MMAQIIILAGPAAGRPPESLATAHPLNACMHLGALGPPLGHWRRTNYVPAPSMLHNNICEVQNITWNATYWVRYLCNFVLMSFNALWHACMLRVCSSK